MTTKLLFQALLKVGMGILCVGALLFAPAGTFAFWNAWLLMGLLFLPMLLAGIVLLFKNPELLKKRLNAKEKEKEQRTLIGLSAIMFIAGFIVAGLTFRFGWIPLPKIVVGIACVLFAIGYGLYAEVIRENQYLSRTIEVVEGQKVVDTGLYGIVRHPMYVATLFLFMTMPLILGSLISFVIFLLYPWIIVRRIKNEEAVLEKELDGYLAYEEKVKYRLLWGIW